MCVDVSVWSGEELDQTVKAAMTGRERWLYQAGERDVHSLLKYVALPKTTLFPINYLGSSGAEFFGGSSYYSLRYVFDFYSHSKASYVIYIYFNN